MASIVIAGDTSGAVTIAAPATAGTPTLTLPTTSGTLVVTGGAQTVQFAAGSAAAPSITFTGDTNTGIFSPAADTIAFSEGGVESMRIDSSGNVGIGTSSPKSVGNYTFVTTNATTGSGYTTYVNGTEASNFYANPLATVVQEVRALPLVFETNATERMRIDSSGNLLVGTTSGSSKIVSSRATAATAYNNANLECISTSSNVIISLHSGGVSAVCLRHVSGVANIQARNLNDTGFIPFEASAFTVSSDYRLKENIVPLTDALERVSRLPVHRFNFKSAEEVGDDYGSATVDGFLAHEVADVVPEAVFGEKDAVRKDGTPIYQTLDQSKLVPLLIASVKELNAKVEAQAAEIAALKGAN